MPAAPISVVGGVDVDALAAAVRACPAVADLSSGPFGTVATYLPGRRVAGVSVRDTGNGPVQVEVHVVAIHGPTMATVAEQVHAVITAHAPNGTATVAIDDIATPVVTQRSGRDAEFRDFVRTHHPDAGGNPDVFVAGLAAYGRSPRAVATPPITVVRSRSLAGRVRRLRRVLRRRPSRTTPLR